jgi:hypothetical protein
MRELQRDHPDPSSVSLVNSTKKKVQKATRKHGNMYNPKLLPCGRNGVGISLPVINNN